MKKLIIISLFGLFSLSACNDLDIPPKNLITDEGLMQTESGMAIYMARMYSYMPFEDFKYLADFGFRKQGWLNAMGIDGTGEAVNRDGICRTFTSEGTTYWNDGNAQPFKLLHDANYLLETLPKYRSSFSEMTYNSFLGEAYYVRATVFTAMAKRFGGIPLVTRVIPYPGDSDKLEVPRASEEQTWDQILADFDKAVELLPVSAAKRGYCSKDIALSFKSEAMLYAGSVAKYNETVTGRLTGLGTKTGVRVIGFDATTWKSASIRYFKEAYSAAQTVITNGTYSLYKKKWAAGDAEAQYQNMVTMFSDVTSPENIYMVEYEYPTYTHAYDSYNLPTQFKAPLNAGTCPTLDFLELYEGFTRYIDGTVKVTNGTNNISGTYIMYDKPMDFFANAEPRLRAYVIFPGDVFKGQVIDIKAGTYTGAEPISPLFSSYSYANSNVLYQSLTAYTSTSSKTLYLSPGRESSQELVLYNGSNINAAGLSGPFYGDGGSALAGMYGRKWLNTDPSFAALEGTSAQPFIVMRYAEVLLNMAEAAVELNLLGETVPNGMTDATAAINLIRERAGASLYSGTIPATTDGRDEIRKERRKELALEQKTKWDVRRWRVNHYEGRDGFWGMYKNKDTYSDNNNFRFRGLYPFFSTASGKYFFDARYQWVSQKTFSFSPVDYYFAIPGGEVSKSLVIDQQPNR